MLRKTQKTELAHAKHHAYVHPLTAGLVLDCQWGRQWGTYRSPTIYTRCRNTFDRQPESLCEASTYVVAIDIDMDLDRDIP